MNIEITNQELREIKELVEEYKELSCDDSYFYHLANYLISLMVKKGVINKEDLP